MRTIKSFIPLLIVALLLCIPAFAEGPEPITCPLHAGQNLSLTGSGATEVIPVPTLKVPPIYINGTATTNPKKSQIVICSIQILVNQAGTAADYGIVSGTGTNCGTGQTNLTPQWAGTASVKEVRDFSYNTAPLLVLPGDAVCAKLSNAPTKAQVFITYALR